MRKWVIPILLAGVLVAALASFDSALSHQASNLWARCGGDVKRTVETIQQYGDIATTVLIGLVILLQDRARRVRLWDLAAGSALTGLVCVVFKIALGRPRPNRGLGNDWLLWHGTSWAQRVKSDYWSMPSSHTAAAMALSIFLIYHYPRLRPLAVAMVVVVGACRVITGAHYPTDMVTGALVGYLVARPVVEGHALGRWIK